jgi:hypothetical protein
MLSQNPIHQNLPSFIRRVFVLLVSRVLHRVFEPLCKIWRMGPNHEHSRVQVRLPNLHPKMLWPGSGIVGDGHPCAADG